jgi:hypothetical protein
MQSKYFAMLPLALWFSQRELQDIQHRSGKPVLDAILTILAEIQKAIVLLCIAMYCDVLRCIAMYCDV